MKKIYNNILYLKALMLVMFASLFAFGANAQSWTYDQTFNSLYLGERDTVVLDTSATFFDTSVRYYLYRDNDNSFDISDGDEILDQSTSIGDTTLTYVWDESGTTSYRYGVAAISGFGTNVVTSISDVTVTGVPSNDAQARTAGATYGALGSFPFASDNYYAFDNVGFRGLETGVIPELDVPNATTATVSFDFYLTDIPEDSDDSVVFEYSLDGTTWVTLIDSLNNGYDDLGETPNRVIFVDYELPNAAKDANTRFRFRQGPTSATTQRSNYVEGEAAWYIDPDNFQISVGDQNVVFESQFTGGYSINLPFTTLSVTDTTATQNYFGGGGFEIDATFFGYEDQFEDFSYVAVFRNSETGQSFTLENSDNTFTETVFGPGDYSYAFEIDGVIPTNIDYSDPTTFNDWTVSVEAFTGSTPTVSNSDDLLTAGSVEGGADVTNFNGDVDRSYLTDELDIQTVSGAVIVLDLNKNLNQFYPSGSEVVLEYSTDGETFSSLIANGRSAAAISLNDTIDGGFDPFIYDLSGVTGIVSETTQFRVRQLSNSGLNLDTWGIGQFLLSTEGSLLENNSTISYNSQGITINPPTIELDPVDVPDDFIYPGDEVVLTYNVTEGEFPAGTMFTAVLEGGFFDYMIGTSNEITPGDDQDLEITVTIPPLVGGNYSVKLITNPESNSITIPVFDTEVNILGVSSDNGITDNGVDIFYPGDNISVDYEVTGAIGAGAELFLEIWSQGDPSTADDDEWVVINSATDLTGSIGGAVPTGLNLDDPTIVAGSGVNAPKIRLRIGNGRLANTTLSYVLDVDGVSSAYSISDDPNITNVFTGDGYIYDVYDESLTVGNNPLNIRALIGSGERSFTTLPYEMPFGGFIYLELFGNSYEFDQEVFVQASNDDGANWTTINTIEYTAGDLNNLIITNDGEGNDDVALLPESVWGDAVRFRVIYNEDGAASEFENELLLVYNEVAFNGFESANSVERNIGDQLRRFQVSLEVLDDTDFVVGEEVTVEYTTEGPFPANTGFALIFDGELDNGNVGDGNYDDGENFFTVVATSTATGAGSFTFNVPDMAYEFDGTNADLDLYDRLSVIAYDATGGADFLPNERIDIDSDDFFLVIEGTDEEDGSYTFDLAGDRSILTQAFDLSAAQAASLNFNYSSAITSDDNVQVIPQLQYSIDAGATFVNIDVEDSELEGGALVGVGSTSVEVPAEAITTATHFRWVQNLNLGANQNTWSVSGISVELINGNEIDTDYNVGNDNQSIVVRHPSIANYQLVQTDPTDAIFNGESTELSFSSIFETTDPFPANTSFEYLLFDVANGVYVNDPETNSPLVIGTATATGAFTASIPFYVVNGSYDVRLVATKSGAEEPYYYVGSENGGDLVGSIEVFLRVLKTTVDVAASDVVYAGETVTFDLDLENDATNLVGADDLFATVLVRDFSGTDDLIIATQTGIAAITVELPTYLRGGNYEFVVELSEGAPLGEVGDLYSEAGALSNLEDNPDDFINGTVAPEYIETLTYFESTLGYNANQAFWYTVDYQSDGGDLLLQYSIDGGAYVTWINFGSSDRSNSPGYYLPSQFRDGSGGYTGNNSIQFRWTTSDNTGVIDISNVYFQDISGANRLDVDDDDLISGPNRLIFENNFGRGLITSREFEAGELENQTLLSFDLTFSKLANEIAANQFLVFEYSVDGGATYTEIDTYPEVDEEEMTLNGQRFQLDLDDLANDVRANAAIFRFRQEERNNIAVAIQNFSFTAGEALPFDYVSDMQSIAPQVALVSSLGADAACLEDELSIGVELRGRLGAEAVLTVSYESLDGSVSGTVDTEITGLTQGTGTVTASLPTDVFTNGESNKSFRFRVNYEDETFIDDNLDFSSSSEPLSENSIEIVAPVDLDANATVISGTLECEGDELRISLNSPQNYFSYEVINDEDGAVVGTLTYDPEEDEREILITGVTADADLKLRVTAAASSGELAACANPITSSSTIEVRFSENLELNLFNTNLGISEVVAAGDALQVCEGTGITLTLLRDGVLVGTDRIEWFRDDINTPLADTDATLVNNAAGINNQSGSYFARVTTGSCSYLTEAIAVTVLEALDQPEILVVSGNLEDCDNSDPVVLEAPTGFAFYQWSTPTGTRTKRVINAEDQGTYTLRVSNTPFSGANAGCASAASDPVYVERYSLSEFGISTTTSITAGDVIVAGQVIEACVSETIYFFDDNAWTANGGTIEIIKDGVSDGFTTSNSISLDESGVYSFNWINDDASNEAPTCTVSSVEFTLTIFEVPDAVVISTTDATNFCEGQGSVTLTAPAGFAQYRWLLNGSAINSNSDGFGNANNTITVSAGGDYAVQVSNETDGTGCFSNQSNEIEVNVRPIAFDNISFNQVGITCGPGEVVVEVFNTDPQWSYQFYEQNSDSPVGPAFIGTSATSSVFVTLDEVSEQTDYYVLISYADGSGCAQLEPSEFFTATFYNVALELEGNTIRAISAGGFGYSDIEWFRNGVRLQQRSGDSEITISDAAEYSAEVTFGNGECVIVTNSVAIEAAQNQTFFGELEATTYPNPTTDFINVDMKGGDLGAYQISVANLAGQVMLAEQFQKQDEEDEMSVDVRSIEKGIYTLIIRKGNTVRSFRFVKQ